MVEGAYYLDMDGPWRANRYSKRIRRYYPNGAPEGIYSLNEAVEFARFMSENLQRYGIPYDVKCRYQVL